MSNVPERLRNARAYTQKTFLHSRDWADGRKLLDEAAEIIEQNQIDLLEAQGTIEMLEKKLAVQGRLHV